MSDEIERIMAGAGLKRATIPGKITRSVSWKQTGDEIPLGGIAKEFPGLVLKSEGMRNLPGQPMTWEYEVSGPPDVVSDFVRKYGNDNLKAEMGLL